MVVAAGILLFGGVALAREQQTGDRQLDPVVASPTASASPTFDDKGGNGGGNGADDNSQSPTASATGSPSATADDHGGKGRGSDD